jgi:hypothetical protein
VFVLEVEEVVSLFGCLVLLFGEGVLLGAPFPELFAGAGAGGANAS